MSTPNNQTKIIHLMFAITASLERNANQILAKNGETTFTEYKVLSVLNFEPSTQTAIADYLNISKAAVCRTISSLKEKKFVTLGSLIGRREILSLTPKGEEVLRIAKEKLQEETKVGSEAILSQREQDDLIKILKKLYSKLK